MPARYGGGVLNQGTLNSTVATDCPGPEIARTVGELVDVLVEFVFPSESGVTYLSNPRLMTTHETVFSICKELILISMQHLPYCGLLVHHAVGHWQCCPFFQLVCFLFHHLHLCTDRRDTYFSNNMDGFVTQVCPTETDLRNPVSLEASPVLMDSGWQWVA